jgi:hypothetical protein
VRAAVAVALVAFAVIGVPRSAPSEKPVSVDGARPVIRIVATMNDRDARLFRSIYANAAKIVSHDATGESLINSTDDLRKFHVATLRFLWNGAGGNSLDKYSGLRTAVEKALADAVGDDSRSLTPEMRQKAVDLFAAIGG